MAELHSCYPSSPSDKRKLKNKRKHPKGRSNRIQRKRDESHEEPASSYSSARCPPALTPLSILGGNFPTLVAARKSITALSHFSMESSSETCTCRHRPALHPVAFHTSFQSTLGWFFHRLQWRKRCFRVWAAVLPPPPHHQHLSSSRCPNRFRYVPTGACPNFSR